MGWYGLYFLFIKTAKPIDCDALLKFCNVDECVPLSKDTGYDIQIRSVIKYGSRSYLLYLTNIIKKFSDDIVSINGVRVSEYFSDDDRKLINSDYYVSARIIWHRDDPNVYMTENRYVSRR